MVKKTISLSESKPYVTLDAYLIEKDIVSVSVPSIIICPGGGYVDLSSKEGKNVATYLNAVGYNVFVLSYSVKNNTKTRSFRWSDPLLDLGMAVLYIKNNAIDLNVDRDNIYMWFFCWRTSCSDVCDLLEERFACIL